MKVKSFVILLSFCFVIFSCIRQTNTPPEKKDDNVGQTKFVISSIAEIDDYFSQYHVTKTGNHVISEEVIAFSDSINKFHVGDILTLKK